MTDLARPATSAPADESVGMSYLNRTPQRLLVCEFNAVGYELRRFERLPDTESYFASFEPAGPKPAPEDIPGCQI